MIKINQYAPITTFDRFNESASSNGECRLQSDELSVSPSEACTSATTAGQTLIPDADTASTISPLED